MMIACGLPGCALDALALEYWGRFRLQSGLLTKHYPMCDACTLQSNRQ